MRRSIGLRIEPFGGGSSLQTRCERAVSAGFDGIELPIERVMSPGNGGFETTVGPMVEDSCPVGLSVLAVATRCPTCKIEPAIEQVRALLNRASDLQASCLNVSIPPLRSYGGRFGFHRYQDALNFAYRLLREVRHDAESAGVVVALEAAESGCFLSPVELRTTIDQANSWAVGACIDVNRITRIGSPVDWLVTLRRQVHCVRIADAPHVDRASPDCGSQRRAEPDLRDLAGISAVLDEIPYEGPIIAADSDEPKEILRRLGGLRIADCGFPVSNSWLVRESLLAPMLAGIVSRGPLEPAERRIGILLRLGTR